MQRREQMIRWIWCPDLNLPSFCFLQELEAVGAGPELDRMVADYDAALARKAGPPAAGSRR